MKQTQVRMPDEAMALIKRAADFLHTTYSDFMRQAAVKEARIVLGIEPTCPLINPGSQPERKTKESNVT